MGKGRTTAQAAKSIGKSKAVVITTINRHPHLKPAESFGQSFVWTDSEVARLAAYFGSAKVGRPAKQ